MMIRARHILAACGLLGLSGLLASAQIRDLQRQFSESFYAAMRWRCIGPHRGGRALAVSGVHGQPETFYFGAVGGGVWKTTDGGEVWFPVFDGQPISSIGALAVAPSDPNIIYVGSGEADMRSDISFGDGIYKSIDAGKTWTHLGLRDSRQIGRILIDSGNPNVVLVAALGHGFGPNEERGVFRSTDGGKSWEKVLYRDENTGAIDLASDPDNFKIVYASLWNTRRPPWSVYAPINGPGGGLYRSTDAGMTWKEVSGHGLPVGKLGRIGIAVVKGGRRVYALIDAERGAGLYRSDDQGESWKLVGADPRIDSRAWYFSEVRLDPRNANVVYVSNVSLYRSTDGGETFTAIKGAPGGDDYHSLWIDPDNPQRMISGSDQGVTISVDGGRSWSSWYNQATAQFYHVAVDNQFPYWVYGAQQDSGTAAVSSRSDFGQITFRDWHPIGAGESGYILPDPANADIVLGGSTGGELYRFDARTGQVQDITPTPQLVGAKTRQRYPWTTPIAFSKEHVLYQASQFLFRSTDDGMSWAIISPDLTLRPGEREDTAEGVIYTIAPSAVRAGQIWVGTDTGLIQLTEDQGKSWQDVSPPGMLPWSMISLIDASPFDAGTAYAAIDRHQVDDLQPHIYRTHDFGKTWAKITDGIADKAYVHAVREDPRRQGLLFAGTELGVYVSFDDGDAWQPLQLNLPITPIRDLVIKGDDLVVATHGRGFWILDDITPLRELKSAIGAEELHLFKPAVAFRLRKNESHDTPLPPETPAGQNPPAGAIIDFVLRSVPAGPVTLEILDGKGSLVRKYSSDDQLRRVEDTQAYPAYWQRPTALLSRQAGMNRFVWDLRYERPQALRYGTSIAAVSGDDVIQLPQGPLVLPGLYQVRLSVNGQTLTAPLEVRMDPRVSTPAEALEQQLALEMRIAAAMAESYSALQQIRDLRRQLRDLESKLANDAGNKSIVDAAKALDEKAAALGGGNQFQFPPPTEPSLAALNGALGVLMVSIDSADSTPTTQAAAAFAAYSQLQSRQLAVWGQLKESDLASLNSVLRERNIAELRIGQ